MKLFLKHHPYTYKTLILTASFWFLEFYKIIVYEILGMRNSSIQIKFKVKLTMTVKASNIFHVECKTERF